MIQEIFEKVALDSAFMDQTLEEVEAEIARVMEAIGEEETDREKLRDYLYGVAFTAEKAAFEAGFRYAAALFKESE